MRVKARRISDSRVDHWQAQNKAVARATRFSSLRVSRTLKMDGREDGTDAKNQRLRDKISSELACECSCSFSDTEETALIQSGSDAGFRSQTLDGGSFGIFPKVMELLICASAFE